LKEGANKKLLAGSERCAFIKPFHDRESWVEGQAVILKAKAQIGV